MRSLRVLGLADTAGTNLLLEDAATGEQFAVPSDDRLRAGIRGDLSRFGQLEIEADSQLRPKEIQARIRAGASVEQIAALAGTNALRVERFAYPVLLERASMVERAKQARPSIDGITAGASVADTVAATLAGRGHDGPVTWDAYRDDDGWILTLAWSVGRSENRAHWLFHPGPDGGTLSARDDAAAEIVDPALRVLRPLRPVRPENAAVGPDSTAPAMLDPTLPTAAPYRPVQGHAPSAEAASRSAHPAGGKLRAPDGRPTIDRPTPGNTRFGRQPVPTNMQPQPTRSQPQREPTTSQAQPPPGPIQSWLVAGAAMAHGNAERIVEDEVAEDVPRNAGETDADRPSMPEKGVVATVSAVTAVEVVAVQVVSAPTGPTLPSGSPLSAAAAAESTSAAVAPATAPPAAAPPGTAPPATGTSNRDPAPPPALQRAPAGAARSAKRGQRPAMPSWEDVLLGTRATGQ